MPKNGSSKAVESRARYVNAFNTTMVNIWTEKIRALDIIDTGALLNSVASMPVDADGRFLDITLKQHFLEYGLWQEYGTGKEVPRGNPGDIGRDKVRQRRPWYARKYFSSVMNLKDFLADSVGQEFCGIVSNAFREEILRYNH